MNMIRSIRGALSALLPSRSSCRQIILFSLLFLFAAHAFCFFNLTYSGDAVMISVSKGRSTQISSGAYLQPFYFMARGGISSPLFCGMLSAVCLTLTALCIAALLRLSHPVSLFVLCGALIVNPSVLSVCAASLSTCDAAFLSLLLAAAGALLSWRTRFGFPAAACLFAAASALDPSGLSCGASLVLLAFARDLLSKENRRAAAFRSLAALFAGACAYAAGYYVLIALTGYPASAVLQLRGGSLLQAWLAPVRLLFAPLNAYPVLSCLLVLLVFALSVIVFVRHAGSTPRRVVCFAVCMLLLPFAVNLPVFSSSAPGQTGLAFPMLLMLPLAVLDCAIHRKVLGRAVFAAFSVLFLGGIVFSNQVYVKKNLEYHSTVSVMTRVIDRIEKTEGFQPGYTPVALIGTLDDSALSVAHRGFEHLSALEAAQNNYAVTTQEDNVWYTWEIMGYPLNFVSEFERGQLAQTQEVAAMPAYPAKDCIRYMGDVLVVKLSGTP